MEEIDESSLLQWPCHLLKEVPAYCFALTIDAMWLDVKSRAKGGDVEAIWAEKCLGKNFLSMLTEPVNIPAGFLPVIRKNSNVKMAHLTRLRDQPHATFSKKVKVSPVLFAPKEDDLEEHVQLSITDFWLVPASSTRCKK